MSKFPNSPGVARLVSLEPAIVRLEAATRVARVYYTGGDHPTRWNTVRTFGPLNARWDHHQLDAAGNPHEQDRGVYYAAADGMTCLAEVFQTTRRIDRTTHSPWLVIFESAAPLELLDLSGAFATRMGASMAIHSGSRGRARGWARDLYEAFPTVAGFQYASSMNGGATALALNERAWATDFLPPHPIFNRALADDAMVDTLKYAAWSLGYALR